MVGRKVDKRFCTFSADQCPPQSSERRKLSILFKVFIEMSMSVKSRNFFRMFTCDDHVNNSKSKQDVGEITQNARDGCKNSSKR